MFLLNKGAIAIEFNRDKFTIQNVPIKLPAPPEEFDSPAIYNTKCSY